MKKYYIFLSTKTYINKLILGISNYERCSILLSV
jgi:hypothetical protein